MSLYRKNSNHEIIACVTPEYVDLSGYVTTSTTTKIVKANLSTSSRRIGLWQEYRKPFFRNENYKVDVQGECNEPIS